MFFEGVGPDSGDREIQAIAAQRPRRSKSCLSIDRRPKSEIHTIVA
jgi:hypothetical protein